MTAASERAIPAAVKVLVFKLEGGMTGVYRDPGDDTIEVTLKANAGAGLEVSTPGRRGRQRGGRRLLAEGRLLRHGPRRVARTWEFDSSDDADEFIDDMVEKVMAKADPIPNFLQDADDYDLPEQESDTVYGGSSRERLGLQGGGGGGYAAAERRDRGRAGRDVLRQRRRDVLLQGEGRNQRAAPGCRFAGGFGAAATARS